MGVGSWRGLLLTYHMSESYVDVSGDLYHATECASYIGSAKLKSLLFTCIVHGFIKVLFMRIHVYSPQKHQGKT